MKCKDCDFYTKENNFCKVRNISFWAKEPQCYFFSKNELMNSKICFNCKHWIGNGDFGLSCRIHYHVASSNGFDVACSDFERDDKK